MASRRPDTLSVSDLNKRAKILLETHINQVWVEGEISNFSRPGSGHWYFSLKDSRAQIRCAMFRNRNLLIKNAPQAGDQVLVRGRLSLYEARGDYQMIVDHLEAAGDGILLRQFEALKQKLASEGLFESEHKKPLPEYVSRIAVITSGTGAALHDIITVLKRRNSTIEVIIVPTVVQGTDAPSQLIAALDKAERHVKPDAIIIGRGGGSLEDLQAFNDEALARRIFANHCPIVSAVGHEIDFSISDFVADYRAPTPSAAAEVLSGDLNSLRQTMHTLVSRMHYATQNRLKAAREQSRALARQLKHPGDIISQWQQRCDICEQRLIRVTQQKLLREKQSLLRTSSRLNHRKLSAANKQRNIKIAVIKKRLIAALTSQMQLKRAELSNHANALNIVSPLSTLARGYSITRTSEGGLIRSIANVKKGDALAVQVADGHINTVVLSTDPQQKDVP